MKVDQKSETPFRGWSALRAACWTIGPLRVLRWLLERVHSELRQQDGTFRGNGVHNYANHPIAARVLVRLLADRPNWAVMRGTWPMDPCGKSVIADVLRQLTHLTGERTRLSRRAAYDAVKPLSREHVARVMELLWLETLRERGRSSSVKSEVARAWLMLRRDWPACRAEEAKPDKKDGLVKHPVRDPLSTAFDSLEHALFLSIALYICRGVIPDPKHAFMNVHFPDQLPIFISWYVPRAEDAVGNWTAIEAYGQRGLETCFQDLPIVRLEDGTLLAPDLGMVLPGIATRSVARAIVQYASENEHVFEAASNVLGHVFERYVSTLLEECTRHSGAGKFCAEFILADGTRSADAIVVEQSVTLFEVKVTSYPWPLVDHLSPSAFLDWLRKVTGERPKTGRRPLEQGANFVERWRAQDAECIKRLGNLGTFRYVVVTAEDLPPFLAWERFRDEFWRPTLGVREQALDRQTLFISVRDLEALTDTIIALGKRGTPRSVESLLEEWRGVWSRGGHIFADVEHLKPSLKGYLVSRYRPSWEDRPRFVSEAFDEAWGWVEAMLR